MADGQLVSVPGFIGPSNPLRSIQADAEDLENWYFEANRPGIGVKNPKGYYGPTPGVRPFARVDGNVGPNRAMWFQDGRSFVVSDTLFAEVFLDGTTTTRGTVGGSSIQSSIISNGSAGMQMLVCDGRDGWVFDMITMSFTKIDNINFPGTGFPVGQCIAVEFIDGYAIALQRNSNIFFISTPYDFTAWDPLDFGQRSESSDNFVAVKRNGRELWFPGSLTGEVWTDVGDPLFPFAPISGVFMESGATGPTAFVRYMDSLAWLRQDEHGGGVINIANGYKGQRISTHAVEIDINNNVTDLAGFCFMWTQQHIGHEFLWVLFPELKWTWVFDGTTGEWHKRDIWNPVTGLTEPHIARNHMFAWGQKHLVGSRVDGTIYELRLDVYTDEIAS